MCSAAQHFVRYRPAAGDHASHAVQAFRAVPWLFGGRAKFSLKSSFFSDSVCSFYPHESCIVANVIIISVSSLFLFYRHFCFIIIFVFSLFRLLQGCFAGGLVVAAVEASALRQRKITAKGSLRCRGLLYRTQSIIIGRSPAKICWIIDP